MKSKIKEIISVVEMIYIVVPSIVTRLNDVLITSDVMACIFVLKICVRTTVRVRDFLNELGKSIIERLPTLTVILGLESGSSG